MKKWADFLISAVRREEYNSQLRITHFKIHSDEGLRVSGGRTWTRQEVIDTISEGKTFITIFRNTKGAWKKGREVFLHKENGDYVFNDDISEFSNLLKDIEEF